MRALGRFRWLLPALAVPACVVVAVADQAAAFGKAPEDARLAAGALRELVRFHVMRGTELIDGRSVSATCVQGWFTGPRHRRLVRGACGRHGGTGDHVRDDALAADLRRPADERPAPRAVVHTHAGVHGWSDLVPGGGRPAIERVRQAFRLRTLPRHGRA